MYFAVVVIKQGEAERLIPICTDESCQWLETWPDEEMARDAISHMPIKPGREILLIDTSNAEPSEL